MMADKPAPLAGVIVRKGVEPAASVPAPDIPVAPAPDAPAATPASAPALPPLVGTIAVTLRLDPDRYTKLKALAVATRRTNQDILKAALDDYLRKQARTHAIKDAVG